MSQVRRFSIFRDSSSCEEKSKRHILIHQLFKKRLFVPFMHFTERFLGKFMVSKLEEIPDEPYNKPMRLIWQAFEEGAKKYCWEFNGGIVNGKPNPDREAYCNLAWNTRENLHWYKIPKLFLKFWATIYTEDTAYREETNVFLFTLQEALNKAYHPEIQHKHPMYINQYDSFIQYFVEWIKLTNDQGQDIMFHVDPEKVENKYKPKAEVNIPLKVSKETKKLIEKIDKKSFDILQERLDNFLYKMLSSTADEEQRFIIGITKMTDDFKKRFGKDNDFIMNAMAKMVGKMKKGELLSEQKQNTSGLSTILNMKEK